MTLRPMRSVLAASVALLAIAPASASAYPDGPGRVACQQAQRAINNAERHLERESDPAEIAFWNAVLFTNLNYRNTYCNF